MSKRLVLFDIDGTLVTTNGLARHHFADALEAVAGVPTNARMHDFAGKMDPQIYYELLRDAGIDSARAAEMFHAFAAEFYRRLAPELTVDTIEVLPGIKNVLEALQSNSDITLALLTGNMHEGAWLKLSPVGLFRYFAFGAFGDDAMYRHELPAVALDRAKSVTGRGFSGKEIVIIGDTPHDISCGQAFQVRSIAVATGTYSYDSLAEYSPDYLFHTLEDTQAVVRSIRE